MALKYYFEFADVQNILHRCEIYNDTFVGDSREVQGTLSLTKASTKDTLEAIRGGGLQIDLEATNLGDVTTLVEPEATNTATDSNDFTTGDIFVSSAPPSLISSILTSQQATSPDGTNNAWKLADNNNSSSGVTGLKYGSATLVSNSYNTVSLFVKKQGDNDFIYIRSQNYGSTSDGTTWFNIANGTLGTVDSNHTSNIVDYGNGWYRCSITFQSSTDKVGQIQIYLATSDGATTILRDGTNGVYIYGLQAESHATRQYATSYIPTSGSPVTREAVYKTETLSFNDLYSENEREYSVKYYRDSTLMFYGWLSPEGLIESFVDEKWIISLDCTDGLGFLNNLSYVNNSTGLTFTGKQSALEIITNCLKRTNLEQNIYTSIYIYYTGMTANTNVLVNTYFNSNRFIKDDNNTTIMNCEEVLRSILEIFGCSITQYEGNWYIYKSNELFDDTSLEFFAYDSDGIALPTPKVTVEFIKNLGSQINNFYPHHVNKNQQLTIDSSVGAYRINYKYGLVKSFIENKYLQSVSSTDIPGYNIINNTYLIVPFDTVNNTGVTILQNNTSIVSVLETSNSIILPINQQFDFFMRYFIGGAFVFGQFEVILTGTSNTYYLKKLNLLNTTGNSRFYSSEWTLTQTYITAEKIIAGEENETITSEPLPEAGNIKVVIYTSDQSFGSSAIPFNLTELNITPNVTNDNIQGENHTFQIIDKPSTKIEKTKEVFNGDNDSDIYVGTIYKSDETTPTETWTRGDHVFKPILQIMGEERMKMYAKPLRVFSGDVFGYIDYLSVISIDGIDNVLFMPIEYDYNAETNITKLKLKQILNNQLPDSTYSDIDYQLTFDYGNVVEPTIKG